MSTEPTPRGGDEAPLDAPPEDTSPEPVSDPDERWREWMMVGVGWTAVLSVIAAVISIAAVASTNPRNTVVTGQAAAATAPAGKPEAVKLIIKSDTEHGKKGPDGKWHDAFLPANFTIHAGDTVTVTVDNYDTMPHTFTSSTLSASQLINQNIPAGSPGAPTKTTFTFTAPSTAGKYLWWCAMPCDPYAMAHIGYMRGYVTVAT